MIQRIPFGIFYTLMAILLLSGQLDIAPHIFGHMAATDQIRVYRIFILSLIGILATIALVKEREIYASPPRFTLLLLFGLIAGLISSSLAPLKHYAFLYWAWHACCIISIYFFSSLKKKDVVHNFYPNFAVAMSIGLTSYTILYYFNVYFFMPCDVVYCYGTQPFGFDNIRAFNSISVPFYIGFVFAYPSVKSQQAKYLFWGIGSLCFSLVFATQARSELLALTLPLCIARVLFGKQVNGVLVRSVTLLAGGFAMNWFFGGAMISWRIYGDLWHSGLYGRSIEGLVYSADRLALWHRGFDLWKENPFFGVGPLHFAYGNVLHGGLAAASPHNVLVEWLAEWGIITLICWVSFFFLLFKKSTQSILATGEKAPLAIWLTLFGLCFDALFSGPDLLLIAIFSGLLLGTVREEKNVNNIKSYPMWARVASIGFILGSFCVLFYGMYPDIFYRSAEINYYIAKHGPTVWPRFWAQGNISVSNEFMQTVKQKQAK